MSKYIIFIIWMGLSQSLLAQVRHFNTQQLTGVDIAVREILSNNSEQLICFRRHGPTDLSDISIFEIVGNQLNKVWEHNHGAINLSYDFDTGDLNKDGQLDFAVVGMGRHDNGETVSISHVLLYLSNSGYRNYEHHLLARPRQVFHLAIGNIDGDDQQEFIIAETIKSTEDWFDVELKIVRWRNDAFSIIETGIVARHPETYWTDIRLRDIDNDDRDEALISVSDGDHKLQIYDLDNLSPDIQPSRIIPKQELNSPILVSKKGGIFELGVQRPNLIPLGPNPASKIIPITLANLDLNNWHPIEIVESETDVVVVNRPVGQWSRTRQISIYENNAD